MDVPAQHIIIHPLWFVFFSFPFHTLPFFIFPFLISSLWLGAVVLPVSRLSSCCLQHVWILSFAEFFESSPNSVIICLTISFFSNQRLPFPHSANLSPWNLSNSPCTHSAVPLIACSFTLPVFLSWLFLPWQSDNCWSIHR